MLLFITFQDAFEEVALLGRQLHVRHRGRRRGWVPTRSVSRDGHPDEPRRRAGLRTTVYYAHPRTTAPEKNPDGGEGGLKPLAGSGEPGSKSDQVSIGLKT